MRIIAIEAATFCGSIVLAQDGRIVAQWNEDSFASYSERLLPAVEEILTKAGWAPSDLDGIAVSRGPGSFTALRIGMSVAKTLAYGTGKPLVGVSTLEALALRSPSPDAELWPLIDARRREVFAAPFRTAATGAILERLGPDRALRPEILADELAASPQTAFLFSGDGAAAYAPLLTERLGARAHFVPAPLNLPSAETVARLGSARLARGESDDPLRLEPRYVRHADASPPKNPARGQ